MIQNINSAYSIICYLKEIAKKKQLANRENYRKHGVINGVFVNAHGYIHCIVWCAKLCA